MCRQRWRRHGQLQTMFAALLISMSPLMAVQAQTHPWPVKEFKVDWNDAALDEDLETAAAFYEKNNFLPPTLETRQHEGHFWEETRIVYPIRSDAAALQATPGAAGFYDAEKACACCQNGSIYHETAVRHNPNTLPGMVSDPDILRESNRSFRAVVLSHELFHAVQFSYAAVLKKCDWVFEDKFWSSSSEDWFLEGMAEAMAMDWLKFYHNNLMNDEGAKVRIRGWRPYNSPLNLSGFSSGGGIDAEKRNLDQAYRTSSFWRFLGPELIRAMLEYNDVDSNLDELDWLDQVLKDEWVSVCKKVFDDQVPTPEGVKSCKETSEFAGLYLIYPKFITQFTESERHEGGLDIIFTDDLSGDGGSLRGSPSRIDGCIVAEPSLAKTLFITLGPVAAECVRILSKYTGAFLVDVETADGQGLDHLILGWNGCIQTVGAIVSYPAGMPDSKVWTVNRGMITGISGCEPIQASEDLLLVLSNVAPKASSTEVMHLRLTLRQDSEG